MNPKLFAAVKKIINSQVPNYCEIVKDSIPVAYFGKLNEAKIATIGLNPSNLEFEDKDKNTLPLSQKRFCDMTVLHGETYSNFSDRAIEQIIYSYDNYFGPNYYARWFDRFEKLTKEFGAAFKSSGTNLKTVVHLDFVNWATKEKWADLHELQTTRLFNESKQNLIEILENSDIEHLLLNGRGCTDMFRKLFNKGITIQSTGQTVNTYGRGLPAVLEAGTFTVGSKTICYYAWNVNLQSSHGVSNDLVLELGGWVNQVMANNQIKKVS